MGMLRLCRGSTANNFWKQTVAVKLLKLWEHLSFPELIVSSDFLDGDVASRPYNEEAKLTPCDVQLSLNLVPEVVRPDETETSICFRDTLDLLLLDSLQHSEATGCVRRLNLNQAVVIHQPIRACSKDGCSRSTKSPHFSTETPMSASSLLRARGS